MNNFRWSAPFFNVGRRRRFLDWNRTNNRNGMGTLLTVLGLVGAGAAGIGLMQARNGNNGGQPTQEMLSNVQRALPDQPEAAFSNELLPDLTNNETEQ